MIKFRFIRVLFVATLLLSTVVSAQENKKPNVIFILADDLGINALNCYGNDYVESPNIDMLYNEGIHFTNGYSSDPTCAPSRGAIITGQYVPRSNWYRVVDRYRHQENTLKNMRYLPPENNFVEGKGKGIDPSKISIAKVFKANGYSTAAYGKWHLGHGVLGITAHGFDEGYEMLGHYKYRTDPKQDYVDPNEYSADRITANTIDYIERSVKSGKPFFSYVPYYLVHGPFETKPEYLKHFKDLYEGKSDLAEDEIQVLAMIKSLDESVGQLMDAVKRLGIEDNTIIVFTSDNGHYKTKGTNMFAKPYNGNKGKTLEGGIRVPYIFKWKGHIKPNTVSTEPIIHVDLYPTLVELSGNKLDDDYILDGENLTPILLDPKKKTNRNALVWEYTNYAGYSVRKQQFGSEWVNVIQMDGYKLTEVVESGDYYMYNLNDDPYETTEVIKNFPKQAKKMKKRLEKWKKHTGYVGPIPNPDYKG